jgi:hypothetical protein
VVPAEYQTFFLASAGASAALIGLLFVGVSLDPNRIFGEAADARRQIQAISAFSALANIFFISMTSLIPGVILGLVVTVVATASSLQLISLAIRVPQERGTLAQGMRGVLIFLASAAVYGIELYLGILLWTTPSASGAATGIQEALLGAYAIGLGRAWQLMGAPRIGLISLALERFERRPPGSKKG